MSFFVSTVGESRRSLAQAPRCWPILPASRACEVLVFLGRQRSSAGQPQIYRDRVACGPTQLPRPGLAWVGDEGRKPDSPPVREAKRLAGVQPGQAVVTTSRPTACTPAQGRALTGQRQMWLALHLTCALGGAGHQSPAVRPTAVMMASPA